jgi:hypothetical protein
VISVISMISLGNREIRESREIRTKLDEGRKSIRTGWILALLSLLRTLSHVLIFNLLLDITAEPLYKSICYTLPILLKRDPVSTSCLYNLPSSHHVLPRGEVYLLGELEPNCPDLPLIVPLK